MNTKRRRAFTLIELLVVMAVCVALAVALGMAMKSMRERMYMTKDLSQMRQLLIAVNAYAMQNDGKNYSLEEIGYSSWREVKDPLSLCQLFFRSGVLPSLDIWKSPAGKPEHNERYGNTYCWNRSKTFCGQSASANTEKAVGVFWNNYCYTLPSVVNVSEPPTGGPRNAPANYRYFMFGEQTAANFAYSDGHVELVQIIKPK